jgi:LPXTG-motif cell wall-anchored protein
MSKYVSRGLALVLFTGGLTLLGAGIANAADTTGDEGLLSGTQIVAPITAPVEAAGNAVSVLGDALAGGTSTPAPAPAPAPAPVSTSGADSVLGGTQAVVEAAAPVTVQGNAISVAGDSAATSVPAPAAPVAEPAAPAAAPTTSGSDGIASGTQVLPTVSVPVNLGGNAISVLGDSSSEGASAPAATTGSTGSGDATTSGSDGVAGGTQVLPNVSVPVNVGGNAISVLGDSSSEGASAPAATTGGSTGSTGSTGGATTTGSDSVASGTQIAPDVALPVSIGGNAISILGDAASTGSSAPAAQEGTDGGVTTTGDDGILGGTQVVPSIALPVTVGGNAISVLGDSAVTGGVTGPVAPTDPIAPTVPTVPGNPANPVVTTGSTEGSNDVGATLVLASGAMSSGTAAAFGTAATAALSVQALASTGAEIASLVGLIGLLLAAGIALLVIARRRAV